MIYEGAQFFKFPDEFIRFFKASIKLDCTSAFWPDCSIPFFGMGRNGCLKVLICSKRSFFTGLVFELVSDSSFSEGFLRSCWAIEWFSSDGVLSSSSLSEVSS